MDPVSAVGLAASSLQLASFAFTAALSTIQLVKDLKDVPARLRPCLADAEKSVQRLSDLQSKLTDPNSRLVSFLSQDQLSRLEAVVRDGHDATDALREKLVSAFPQQTASSNRDRVRAAWKSVLSLSVQKDVEDAAGRIQRLNVEISRELQVADLEAVAHLPQHMVAALEREQEVTRTELRREHDVTRAQLRSLGDAILPVMTGQSQTMSVADQAVAVRLSDTDKLDLARQLCEALMSHPSALRQSCETAASLSGNYHTMRTRSKSMAGHNVCVCFKSRRSWTSRLARNVGLEYKSKADHHPACPLANYARQSWSYTLSLSLLPLLSQTVALTFQSKSRGGGWSIYPALKFFATVRRSTSPMFRAFDEHREAFHGTGDRGNTVEKARALLGRTHRLILDMMGSGTGSLTDRDENGRTLLHEVAVVIDSWALYSQGYYKSVPEIRYLLNLAYEAGVDAGCKTSSPPYLDEYDRPTAPQAIMDVVEHPDSWDLIGPEYFGKFPMEDTRPYTRIVANQYLGHVFYGRFEELVEDLGPLGPAVLRKSTAQLISVLDSPTFSTTDYDFGSTVALMYLASAWHDGLRLLLKAGFTAQGAINEALRRNDLDALRLGLESPHWSAYPALIWAGGSSDALQQALVDAIWKQRNEILQLCYKHLTMPELAELGLPALIPLDAKVRLAYEMLYSKVMLRPCLWDWPVYSAFSVPRSHERDAARVTALLEKLYAAGFRNIDASYTFAKILHLRDFGPLTPADWTTARWLALKATSPLSSTIKDLPSAMFDMAWAYGPSFVMNNPGTKDDVMPVVEALATTCDPTQRDACNCFCSEGGCLPSRLFLTRKTRGRFAFCHRIPWRRNLSVRELILQNWCEACHLGDASTALYSIDLVRLEIFDRLGMVHTCCMVSSNKSNTDELYQASCASDEERQQVQYEDSELHQQLALIMEAYCGYAQIHVGCCREVILSGWWRILDEILPPALDSQGRDLLSWNPYSESDYADSDSDADSFIELHPERTAELCDRQAAMGRETLVRMGYGDLDFMEVIRRHLRDYLKEEDDDIRSKNGTEKQTAISDFRISLQEEGNFSRGVSQKMGNGTRRGGTLSDGF